MTYSVQVTVMPLKDLLDPQGKAVLGGLKNLGMAAVEDVRVGKTIDMRIEAGSKEEAASLANEAAKKLLANPVMETFDVVVKD